MAFLTFSFEMEHPAHEQRMDRGGLFITCCRVAATRAGFGTSATILRGIFVYLIIGGEASYLDLITDTGAAQIFPSNDSAGWEPAL